jgi:hypothetical protein
VIASSPLQLQRELETHVQVRTGRRIQNLSVELVPEGVVLRGRAGSYYLKQLAQQEIRDRLPYARLENAIVVSGR